VSARIARGRVRAARAVVHDQRGFSLLELLIACVVGALVVGAGVELLRVHVATARRLQTRLASTGGAAWALTVAARDVQTAGGDPTRAGVAALGTASNDRMILGSDRDASGAVEPDTAERVTLAWSSSGGGRLVRWLGNQSIGIAATVRTGGLIFRYFDAAGSELTGAAGVLGDDERARVRRVALALEVRETSGTITATTVLRTAAALRTRLEER
jgi:prepilin-type N-terminal cleavage/methylation domain-containing protein